jgi:hypothetical protein
MFRNVMMRLLSRAMRVLPVDARHGPLSNLAMGLMVLKTVRFGRVADPAALEQEGKGEGLQQRIANALHDRVAELRGA